MLEKLVSVQTNTEARSLTLELQGPGSKVTVPLAAAAIPTVVAALSSGLNILDVSAGHLGLTALAVTEWACGLSGRRVILMLRLTGGGRIPFDVPASELSSMIEALQQARDALKAN